MALSLTILAQLFWRSFSLSVYFGSYLNADFTIYIVYLSS
jgi:hypothetical protein